MKESGEESSRKKLSPVTIYIRRIFNMRDNSTLGELTTHTGIKNLEYVMIF